MSRVIFPPFEHKSGSTQLEHALDARKLDEAFSELAGVLNGGIDESNLSAGVKFSTVTPGGVSVGTAIGPKYSLVTLRNTYLGDRYTLPTGILMLGHACSSGWLLHSASFRGESPATGPAPGPANFEVYSGTLLSRVAISYVRDGDVYKYWSSAGSSVATVTSGASLSAIVYPGLTWATVDATFKVPVL